MHPLMRQTATTAPAKTSYVSAFVATLAVTSAAVTALPLVSPLRVPFGLLLVLALPGWALVNAAYPRRQMSLWDRTLATVGLSLAVATCSAVLLAAAPVGLSRGSFAALLGVVTVVFSVAAASRGETDKRAEPGPLPREDIGLAKRVEDGGADANPPRN